MGSWGVNLWDSDTALDLKNEYAKCLRYSYDDEDALQRFMHSNEKVILENLSSFTSGTFATLAGGALLEMIKALLV